MNILPEKIVRTRGSDGTKHTSEIFSLDNWLNLNVSSILIIPFLFIFIVFIPALSAFMLLFFCLNIDRESKPIGYCVSGILLSLYLILDIHNGMIISTVIAFFYNNTETHYVIYFNGATLLTNLFVLLFSNTIFNVSGKSNFLSFLIIGTITFFSYFVSMFIFDNVIKIF
jgi:hypothetical protein